MRFIAFACIAACSFAAQAQELVTNGSFEEPVINQQWIQRNPGEVFGDWTVDSDGQGIVQVASFGSPLAVDGSQCLELNFYVQGGVSQTLSTTRGQTYRISFLMAGQTNAGPDEKDMNVDWNGSTIATVSWFRGASGGQWESHELFATATSTQTVLHFRGLQNVDGGPYLDAVSVQATCPADFNGDGFADFFDFNDFVTCFEGGECPPGKTADFDGDGFVDIFDFNAFVDAFETGCGN